MHYRRQAVSDVQYEGNRSIHRPGCHRCAARYALDQCRPMAAQQQPRCGPMRTVDKQVPRPKELRRHPTEILDEGCRSELCSRRGRSCQRRVETDLGMFAALSTFHRKLRSSLLHIETPAQPPQQHRDPRPIQPAMGNRSYGSHGSNQKYPRPCDSG